MTSASAVAVCGLRRYTTVVCLWIKRLKDKDNAYVALQAETAAVVALHVTDRAGVEPIGSRVSPRSRVFDQTAVRSQVCRLMVFTLVLHVINYMDYYSFTDPKGMEG